jgi:thioredoxin reductase
MRLGNMAVGLLPGSGRDATQTLLVRSDAGTENIRARRVLIASGGLEVTREHDQIPGSRPVGVMTPLFVHQMLRQGYLPGTRTVVAGSARYAVATATRLAVAGAQVTLVPPVGTATPEVDVGVRVEEPAHIVEVVGFPRLERIRLQRGGQDIELPADMLVYARRMMANTLWLKGSGIELQPDGSIGVTARFETNLPGVFAMGTVVTPDLDHEASISMGRAAAIALEGSTA